MELHGDVDDWGWGWEYNFLEVTQPAEADLSVQFGTGPAINIKDLTPALVTRYENETHVGADERPRICKSLAPVVLLSSFAVA